MTSPKTDRSPRASAKVWLHRALAVFGIPAVLLLGLEGGLRVAGYGQSARFLIPDDQPGFYRTNPDFCRLFLPGGFDLRPLNFRVAARKPPNTVRIVVLGESAAQGVPAPTFGFAPQLRAQLRARYPGKNIEVINTGLVAINSHVVYQIARDLAGFSPDLFIVYLGNNEVIGPYGPGCAYLSEMPPLGVIRLSVFVRSTRTGQLLSALLGKLRRRGAPAEWGGMAMFVENGVSGDDPRLEAVYRNLEANLRDIVRVATDAGAKTLLCTVVSNLKDCAPLLSRHRPGLAAAELAAWQRAFERGRLEWKLGEADAARTDLLEALRLDPQFADAAFMLGTLELQAGDIASARQHLVAAQHWDALRFRPDPRINEIIRQVARRDAGVSLLDAALLLGSDPASVAPPAGRELLFEHVHFDWEGNYRLARALAETTETVLFSGNPGRGAWLDSASCAAAVGCTAHERFGILQELAVIVRKPPFTNQLTYGEDQARLAHELARAQAAHNDPATLRQAGEVVEAATATDPENADLAGLAESIADEQGDGAGANAQRRRAQSLQPVSVVLNGNEAIKLSRRGHFDEAEQLLQQTARSCSPRDRALIAPAFAELFTRTKRFAEGRSYFDEAIARQPADRSLPLLRGLVSQLAGDTAAAEREFRAIFAGDPANQDALEALIPLLSEAGKTAEAETVTLAAAEHQPGNQANNLRAAVIYEKRHDDSNAIRFLAAAERSGPVTSGFESQLARLHYSLGQLNEALAHLAEARRISLEEGDPVATSTIDVLIAKLEEKLR